jgi:hypothetical protein
VISVLALATFILSLLPQPATAQTVASYGLNFYRLQCITETGATRLGSDEPYMVILVTDLSRGHAWITPTKIFSDMDSGESRNQTVRLWPVNLAGLKLGNMVFLVAILENDRNLTDHNVKTSAAKSVNKNLDSYVKLGHTPQRIIQLILADMKDGIEAARKGDTLIATPQQVYITGADLAQVNSGRSVNKTIEGRGGQSHYVAHFELMRY